MNNFYLFIDTEASGLPRNWSLPYTADDNWPHAIQISWLIYDQDRQLLKKEDHYIVNEGFEISTSAIEIHGITSGYLHQHGERRDDVLAKLADDLKRYKPLLVGHFLKLDYYVLSADFFRSGISNPLGEIAVYCTMLGSARLAWNSMPRQMRLGELYAMLFYKELQGQHNALVDATATADCFFELIDRGEITDKLIDEQNVEANNWRDPTVKRPGCVLPVLLFILLGILIIYISYYE